MSIDAQIKNALLNAFTKVGEDAVFTPALGAPIDCVVDITKGVTVDEGSYDTPVISRVTTLEYLIDQIGRDAESGETFTVGSTVWTVQEVFEDGNSNDGYCGKVIVRKP